MEPSGKPRYFNSRIIFFNHAFRFANQKFKESHIKTIGIDYVAAEYKHPVKGTEDFDKVDVKIWDTAGQERFHTIT
jgi:GTPase SAR1 family protein